MSEKEKKFTEEFMASWKKSAEEPPVPADKQAILAKQAELLKKDPKNERIWFARGVLFADIGRYKDAVSAYEKVVELNPSNKDVYNALGEAYRLLGMHKEAAKAFMRNLELLEPHLGTPEGDLAAEIAVAGSSANCPFCDKPVPAGANACPSCGLEFEGAEDSDLDVTSELEELLGDDGWKAERDKFQKEIVDLSGKRPAPGPQRPKPLTDDERLLIESTTDRKALTPKTVSVSKEEADAAERITYDPSKGAPKRAPLVKSTATPEEEALISGLTKDLTKGHQKTARAQPAVSKQEEALIERTLKGAGRKGLTNGTVRQAQQRPPPPPRQMRSPGLTNGLGKTNGLTNGNRRGLTNGVGRTNGLTNGVGRTNGLTNGLGKTNGLTNGVGSTNGLTNGLGKTNGLQANWTNPGMTNGLSKYWGGERAGMTNGLTNGMGLTNGIGTPRHIARASEGRWKLYVLPLVLAFMLIIPLSKVYVFAPEGPREAAIEGEFWEWTDLPAVQDTRDAGTVNSNIDIIEVKSYETEGQLRVFIEVSGKALMGEAMLGGRGTDRFVMFIDSDDDPATGFPAGALGADAFATLDGCGGKVTLDSLRTAGEANASDLNSFSSVTGSQVAVSGSRVEWGIGWKALGITDRDPYRYGIGAIDFTGTSVFLPYSFGPSPSSLEIVIDPAPGSVAASGAQASLAGVDLVCHGNPVEVESLEFTLKGTASLSSATFSLLDANGVIASATSSTGFVTFPDLALGVSNEEVASLTMSVQGSSAGRSIGISGARAVLSDGNAGQGTRFIANDGWQGSYLGSVPVAVEIDGIFGDWEGAQSAGDSIDSENPSADLTRISSVLEGDSIDIRLDLAGPSMAGSLFPIGAPVPVLEEGTAPVNTSIPAPPAPKEPKRGLDSIRVYVDSDRDAGTGQGVVAGFGADSYMIVEGKDGRVASSSHFLWTGTGWGGANPGAVAIGGLLAELRIPLNAESLGANVIVFTNGWDGASDEARFDNALAQTQVAPVQGTRAEGEADTGRDPSSLDGSFIPAGGESATYDMSPVPKSSESEPLPEPEASSLSLFTDGIGGASGDKFGWNVTSGDVNGDGTTDVIVGAPYAAAGGTARGAVYIFYGGSTNHDVTGELDAADADVVITGLADNGHLGWDVASGFNVNGDSYQDLLMGQPDNGAGYAYILLGSGSLSASYTTSTVTSSIQGEASGDKFGASVSGAGNYDNSGNDDIVIGAHKADSSKGRAYVFLGDGSIPSSATSADVLLKGKKTNGLFGFSVDDAGNVDGTTGNEVIVGEPGNEMAYTFSKPSANTASSETKIYGTITPSTNGYQSTQTSANDYEQVAEALVSTGITDTLIVYGVGTTTTPYYSVWGGSAWGTDTTDGTFAATIGYTVAYSNPVRNEIVAGAICGAGAPDQIFVNVWNGDTNSWGTPLEVTATAGGYTFRSFDIAFETASGNAMVFYGDGTTAFAYRTWDGTQWSAENTYSLTQITGTINWIDAASDPASDEIAILVSDSNLDAQGVIWDGSACGNQALLSTTLSTATYDCHAVEYERSSGYAMFAWGEVATDLYYRQWSGSAWDSSKTLLDISAQGGVSNWITMDANPASGSDQILLTVLDAGSDVNTARWDGSSWTVDTEHSATCEAAATRCADAVFESASGHANHILLAYSADGYTFYFKHFDGTNWGAASTEDGANSEDCAWVQLRRDSNGLIFISVLSRVEFDINSWTWNGAAMTWQKEHSASLTVSSRECFMIAPGVPPPGTMRMEHKWTFAVNGYSHVFNIEAYRTNNDATDTMKLYYSVTGTGTVGGTGWTEMLTVTKTTDDNAYQSYSADSLGCFEGNLHVGVVNSNQESTTGDSLYVDHMYVLSYPCTPFIGEVTYSTSDVTASADSAVSGTVSGTYANTQSSNDAYESITEVTGTATYDSDYAASETFTQSASHVNDYTETDVQDGTTEDIVELSTGGSTSTTQTRYMRSDTTTVNTISGYSLGTTQTTSYALVGIGSKATVYAGIRVWKVSSGGTLTEITSGSPVATVTAASSTTYSATWNCPQTTLASTDSIVVRVYADKDVTPPTTLQATFVTENLGASQLDANTWTVYYYIQVSAAGNAFVWGTSTYNSRIENFKWSVGTPAEYSLEHKWQFSAVPTSAVQYEFQAYVGWATGGDDNFHYYYSTTGTDPVGGGAWTSMFTDNTQALDTWTFDLDAAGFTGGTFYVGVIDVGSSGDVQDTLRVDYMRVYTTVTPAGAYLQHKWTISAPAGTDSTFNFEGYRTNLDSENMGIYYSTTGAGAVSSWTKMFDVTKTSDDDGYQTYSDATLDAFSGTLYIGVIDASTTDTNQDTIYVDHMYLSVGGAMVQSKFGWSVSGAGNLDNSGNDDIIIGVPMAPNGRAIIYHGGDFTATGSRTDTSQSDFTATDSSLESSNPSGSMYATSGGDLTLAPTYLVNENFDSYTVGTNPTGWTVTEGTGYTADVSAEQYTSSPNSVEFTDTSGTLGAMIETTFTGQTLVSVECRIYVTTSDEFQIIVGPANPDHNAMIDFYNGNIYYHNGGFVTFMTYSYNTWYKVMLVLDCGTDTYDVYINDGLQVESVAFNAVASTISRIDFHTTTTSAASDVYLDDVKVSTGYATPGTYTSAPLSDGYIKSATATWTATLNSQTMTVSLSRDGGTTWTAVSDGVEYFFNANEPRGNALVYRVQMSTSETFVSPTLSSITIAYEACKIALTLNGISSGDRFGWSVAGAGDLDGDGYDDVIVGAPYRSNNSLANHGAAYVFLGGSSMNSVFDYYYDGPAAGDLLGWSVCAADNFGGGTYKYIFAGSPGHDSTGTDYGKAQVLSMYVIPEFGSLQIIIALVLLIAGYALWRKIVRLRRGHPVRT